MVSEVAQDFHFEVGHFYFFLSFWYLYSITSLGICQAIVKNLTRGTRARRLYHIKVVKSRTKERKKERSNREVIGARGEARTRDTRLKRAVLFLLSYTRIGERGELCNPPLEGGIKRENNNSSA